MDEPPHPPAAPSPPCGGGEGRGVRSSALPRDRGAERGDEVVELLAGVQFGHRDEKVVVEAFEEVAEGDAAEDLLVLEIGEDLAREERRADDELVVDRTG